MPFDQGPPPDWGAPHPAMVPDNRNVPAIRPAYVAQRQDRVADAPKPPHSLEAEQEVLSAVLIDPKAMSELVGKIAPEDFYFERHQIIFAMMLALQQAGSAVDLVTVRQLLVDGGQYEKVGGIRGLSELMDGRFGTAKNVGAYVDIVRNKAMLRAIIVRSEQTAVSARGDVDSVPELIEQTARGWETLATTVAPPPKFSLLDWTAKRFKGKAPDVEWLIPDMIARSEAHLLAAPGDSGKGFITLNLALQLASGFYLTGRRAPFGRAIMPSSKACTCVMLYAEDSEAAVHRRLESMDRDGQMRSLAGDRFIAVPMPSVDGAMSVLQRDEGGTFSTTARWEEMKQQLGEIPDLGMVLLDPLSCFMALDVDKDSSAAQAFAGELAKSAVQFNCAFMASHHMRKGGNDGAKHVPELPTHEGVRDSIRGVAALLNGVRMAYGIVPLPSHYAKAVLNLLNERGEWDAGKVFWGAVVKANGRTDRRARIYVRSDYGLLEDRTQDIAPNGDINERLKLLVESGK